jgi:hypothetical protein
MGFLRGDLTVSARRSLRDVFLGKPSIGAEVAVRTSLAGVNEEKSTPGNPVLECREPIAIPVGQRVVYRTPIVANARRIAANHRLRLILGSEDEKKLGFTQRWFARRV